MGFDLSFACGSSIVWWAQGDIQWLASAGLREGLSWLVASQGHPRQEGPRGSPAQSRVTLNPHQSAHGFARSWKSPRTLGNSSLIILIMKITFFI